jgi:hypothetical protein
MLDNRTLARLWPWLLMAVLPVCVHLPALTGWLRFDPLYVVSGVTDGTWTTNGLIAGRPGWVDANAGVTTEALGALAARDWLHGVLPWWNPYSGVGLPLAAEGQTTAFFLPFGLLLALPHGLLALRMLLMMLAGLFSLALLRQLGQGRMPATVGAALFQMNGVFAWMAHGPVMPVAFLPLILLGIEHARTRATLPWAIVLGTAWSLSAGFPETAMLDGGLALFWAVLRVAQAGNRLAVALRIISAGIAGTLLAAPAIWPFLQALPGDFLGEHWQAMSWAFLPANWSLLLFPYLFGNIHYDTMILGSSLGIWARAGGYCGIVLVTLALLGLRRRSPETALRWLLLGWIGFVLAKAAGLPIFDAIPLLRQIMWHVYALPSWCMALSILAALALNDWQRGTAGNIFRPALCAAAASAAALVLGASEIEHLWARIPTYPAYPIVSVAEATCALATILALWRLPPTPRRAALMAATIIGQAAALFAFPLLAGTRARAIDTGAIAYLQAHTGFGRIMSFGPLVPNYGAYFGLAELGYNELPVPQTWVDYVRAHFQPGSNGVLLHEGDAPPRGRLATLLPAYEEAGVTTILTWPGETPFPEGTATRVYQGRVMDIWALPNPAPYAAAPGCQITVITRTHILAQCAAPSRLIRRELAAPGWRARVNGAQRPISSTSEVFQSIAVPAGHSDVAFAYTPPSMDWAWTGCGLGALACFIWVAGQTWLSAPVKRRRLTPEKPWNPIATQDMQAANELLRAAQKPWFEGLDRTAANAVDDFKGTPGRPINQYLRGELGDGQPARTAAVLERALAQAAAPADMLLHRGAGPREAALYRSLARGTVTRTTCFVSTSPVHAIAEAVAARQPGGMLIELVVRQGQKGVAYIHPFPTYRYPQFEVLINVGTRLKVLHADAEAIRLEVGNDDGIE